MKKHVLPSSDFITKQEWWSELSQEEKSRVTSETEHLTVSLLDFKRSRVAIGEHLLKIKETLEPKQLFVKFLGSLEFSIKSAYRYMDDYQNSKVGAVYTTTRAARPTVDKIQNTKRVGRPVGSKKQSTKTSKAQPSPLLTMTWFDKHSNTLSGLGYGNVIVTSSHEPQADLKRDCAIVFEHLSYDKVEQLINQLRRK